MGARIVIKMMIASAFLGLGCLIIRKQSSQRMQLKHHSS